MGADPLIVGLGTSTLWSVTTVVLQEIVKKKLGVMVPHLVFTLLLQTGQQ